MFATIFLSTKGGWRHAETVHHITNRLEAEKGRCPGPRGSGLFCSTGILLLEESLRYFSISQQQTQRGKPIAFYNFLTGKHYFRLNRAETPFTDVVLTEGQKRKPSIIQEVAA